jgi:hypothetical protein
MKRFYSLLLIPVLAPLAIVGCGAKTGHIFLEKMSDSDVAEKLTRNKTTKEEVKAHFGDPSDIDLRDNGTEVWIYQFTRSRAKGVNFVPVVSGFYGGTNDNIRRLKIVFRNGIVENYAFSSSKGETKVGAFQ